MYLSLYRKWRPDSFAQVVGQEHVTRVLQNAIGMGRIHHAYLFCGPRGTGKTSIARLFAKALNCEKGPLPEPCNSCSNCSKIKAGHFSDLIEIDAASNRGIDEIRDLRERVRFSPIEGRYKIYIIDEVHMLTAEAFNALLKTLEEPPAHCIFIMATTEPQKIPLTISSRCQYLNFYRISFNDTLDHLRKVITHENVSVAEEGLRLIAKKAEGGLRDALGLLEQAISFGGTDVSAEDVRRMLGTTDDKVLSDFVKIVSQGRAADGFILIKNIIDEGKNLEQFLKDLIERFRDLMIIAECGQEAWKLVDVFEDECEILQAEAAQFDKEEFLKILEVLSESVNRFRYAAHGRIVLEMTLVKLISSLEVPSVPIEKNISVAEEKVSEKIQAVKESSPKPSIERRTVIQKDPEELSKDVGDLELSRFVEQWRSILNAVKKESVKVHAFMIDGEPVSFQENVLTIRFTSNYSFHKQNLEKEPNRQIAEKVIGDFLNKTIKIECLLVGEGKDSSSSGVSSNTASTNVQAEDDLVKAALDIFGGKVVKVE